MLPLGTGHKALGFRYSPGESGLALVRSFPSGEAEEMRQDAELPPQEIFQELLDRHLLRIV